MNTTKSVPPGAGSIRGSRLARRPAAVLALAALMIASLVTAATAQTSVQLNMTYSSGTRTLSVTDLALADLTSLNLVPNVASPYRVAVSDSDYVTNQQFTVESETNNLYLVPDPIGAPETYDFDTEIPSSAITMGVGTGTVSNLGIDLTPVYTLTSTVSTLGDCTALLGTLGLGTADALKATAICTQLAATPVTDVPVVGDVLSGLDLTTLLDQLLALTKGTGGAYAFPSYLGIGAGDTAGIAAATTAGELPTTVDILVGTPATTLAADLVTAITTLVGLDGTQQVATLIGTADTLAALTTALLGPLAAQLGGLTAGGQATVLNALLDLGLQVPVLGDLSNLTGLYTAIPALTAVPDAATTTPGVYSGTHTVRLVSP